MKWAAELELGGFSKPGYPGVLIVEGDPLEALPSPFFLHMLAHGKILLLSRTLWPQPGGCCGTLVESRQGRLSAGGAPYPVEYFS